MKTFKQFIVEAKSTSDQEWKTNPLIFLSSHYELKDKWPVNESQLSPGG